MKLPRPSPERRNKLALLPVCGGSFFNLAIISTARISRTLWECPSGLQTADQSQVYQRCSEPSSLGRGSAHHPQRGYFCKTPLQPGSTPAPIAAASCERYVRSLRCRICSSPPCGQDIRCETTGNEFQAATWSDRGVWECLGCINGSRLCKALCFFVPLVPPQIISSRLFSNFPQQLLESIPCFYGITSAPKTTHLIKALSLLLSNLGFQFRTSRLPTLFFGASRDRSPTAST